MNYATILVHHSFLLGRYKLSYEWQGDKSWPVMVPRSAVPSFDKVWPSRVELDGLPPLRHLPGSEEYDWMFLNDAALYVRTDDLGLLIWLLWRSRSIALRAFWFVYERSVLTLHVWGLADYHPDRRPSWRDIYWFQKK